MNNKDKPPINPVLDQPPPLESLADERVQIDKKMPRKIDKKLLIALVLLLVVFPLLLLAIQIVKPRQVIKQILPPTQSATPTPIATSTPVPTPQPDSKEGFIKAVDDLEQNIRGTDLLQPDIELPAVDFNVNIK